MSVSNTAIQSRDYTSPGQEDALKRLLVAQQAGATAATDDMNNKAKADLAKEQAKAEEQAKINDLARVIGQRKLLGANAPPLHSGTAAVGVDNTYKIAQLQDKQAREAGQDYSNLGKNYNAIEKKYSPILDRINIGMQGLNSGDTIGMKQAIVNMAGATEGQGQRIVQSVIKGFQGDSSLVEKPQELENFLTGLVKSGKSEAFKQAMAKGFQNIHNNIQSAYNTDLQEFHNNAPNSASKASQQPDFGNKLSMYGAPFRDRISKVGEQFKQAPRDPAAAPAPGTGGDGLMSRIGNRLQGFLGGKSPAAPAAPFDPNSYLKGP